MIVLEKSAGRKLSPVLMCDSRNSADTAESQGIRIFTEYIASVVKTVVKTDVGNTRETPSVLESGATRRDRTGDLLITNQPLYQLS